MFRVTDLGAYGALGCGSSRGRLVQRAAQDVSGKFRETEPYFHTNNTSRCIMCRGLGAVTCLESFWRFPPFLGARHHCDVHMARTCMAQTHMPSVCTLSLPRRSLLRFGSGSATTSFESPDSRFNSQVDEALSGVVPLAYVVAFANGGAKDVTQRCGPAHPPQS